MKGNTTMFTTEKTELIDRAFKFAYTAHSGQLDDAGKPFIKHPVQVANILMCVTDDANLIAAAALHDTLEDTETTHADLVREFGQDIADLVAEVTSTEIEGQKVFPALRTQRGIMLKFADRLSNISRMESWSEDRKKAYLDKSKFWKDLI